MGRRWRWARRGAGHISRLTAVGRPDVGIVTSVAMAHVEYFGDLEGVARAKSELVTALPASGLAVLNFDDPFVARMAVRQPVSGSELRGGRRRRRARGARSSSTTSSGRGSRCRRRGARGRCASQSMASSRCPNALAAAAAALWCGVPFEGVVAALATATGSPLRMEVRRMPDGPTLVVDCYNANPASTEAALRSMAALPDGRKLALLGLMAELGSETEAEHRRVARSAEELGIEVVGFQTDALRPAAQVVERRGRRRALARPRPG